MRRRVATTLMTQQQANIEAAQMRRRAATTLMTQQQTNIEAAQMRMRTRRAATTFMTEQLRFLATHCPPSQFIQ